MLGLLGAIQRVELVNSGDWFSENKGPLVLALAAVIAATVAVVNQRSQLAHDREMRFLEDVRKVIDLAVSGANDAIEKVTSFNAALGSRPVGFVPAALSPDAPAWNAKMAEMLQASYQSVFAMLAQGVQLGIRLGEDHPILVQHNRLCRTLSDWEEAIKARSGLDEIRDIEPSADAFFKRTSAEAGAFRLACQQWFIDSQTHYKWWQFRKKCQASKDRTTPRKAGPSTV
jgi:hypothetical protein